MDVVREEEIIMFQLLDGLVKTFSDSNRRMGAA